MGGESDDSMTNYNKRFKAKLIQQALLPSALPISELARSAGVPQSTLWNWVEGAKLRSVTHPSKPPEIPQRPADRSPEEKLRIVLAAHGLSDEGLGTFLRREGVHEADLAEWRVALHEAALASLGGPASTAVKEKADAKRIRELEAEVRRKDKALAETAALLILKKKVLAIWGDGDDGTKPESDD
jgi:transposase-like protein